jgi:hypothetical protein
MKRNILSNFAFYITRETRLQTGILKFKNKREQCRKNILESVKKERSKILNYHISPEKIQILFKGNSKQMTQLMKSVISKTTNTHMSQTNAEGPFWKNRFGATLVQHGSHLLRCNMAINMTMVLQEKDIYPEEWDCSGYQEIIGIRKRYKIIDLNRCAKFSGFKNHNDMQNWYVSNNINSPKIAMFTLYDLENATAIGDLENIESIANSIHTKQKVIKLCCKDEFGTSYGLFTSKNTKRQFTRNQTRKSLS